MKQEERLLNALTNISDELVTDAARKPKRIPSRQVTALVACIAVVIGLAAGIGGFGGSTGGGGQGEPSFDNYIGPVLPLTTLTDSSGLTAARHVIYDFSSYTTADTKYPRIHTDVTDSYTLTNTTDSDMTITAAYPVMARLSDRDTVLPTVAVDGNPVDTALCIGRYFGSYTNSSINSGEALTALLCANDYLADALDASPALSYPVTVYKFGNAAFDGSGGEALTVVIECQIDTEQTTVLTYNASAIGFDDDTDTYSIRLSRRMGWNDEFNYILLLGEDTDAFRLKAYSTANCAEGSEIEHFAYTLERYETSLDEFMRNSVEWKQWRTMYNDGLWTCIAGRLSDEELLDCTAQIIASHSAVKTFGFDPMTLLEDYLSASLYAERIFYTTFELTIPAGESITVTTQMKKHSSSDNSGRGEDLQGYDLITAAGSNLTFTEQTASVVNAENVEFPYQNFGFDPEKGITTVKLDLSRAHYWMNVRKKG